MQCMEVWGGNRSADSGVVMPGLDAWVYSRPYGDSDDGGDVYYVSSCASGRITRLLVADVSGHGASVQSVAVSLRRLMRRFVNHIDQARFVTEMNSAFSGITRNGGFATAVVNTFFAPTMTLSVCNAGHPAPLHYQASKRQWRLLEQRSSADAAARNDDAPANLPLGIIDLSDYDQFHVRLAVGDLVLCYTDSLIESCQPDGCTMLGQQGFLRLMNELPVGDPATLITRVQARLSELCQPNLTGDDVTMLLFRPNGLSSDRPLLERLMVPWMVTKEVLRSWWRRDKAAPVPEASVANLGGQFIEPLSQAARPKTPAKD